ncbi:MAG: ATP-binding protein [Rubrimonas sp.]
MGDLWGAAGDADAGLHPALAATPQFINALVAALETAIWVYDFDACRIVWANPAALRLWDAPDAAALTARDLSAEMSASVRLRLAQHRDDFERDPTREIHEFWTLYPKGHPFRARATLRRCVLSDGRSAMFVEARAEDRREPTTIRSADALLHTSVMTALFDQQGRELYANPAFRTAFGPGRHDFGGDFVDIDEATPFRNGLEHRGSHRAAVLVRTIDGERWHDIQAMRCRDAVTGDGAFLISATDITESRLRQEQLIEALAAAKSADEAKGRFLATISHEMRTPLNGVLGMAALLRADSLTPHQRRAVETIARSGAALLEVVEDMLDLVALDRGGVALLPSVFDPVVLLNAAVECVREAAQDKGLTLRVEATDLGGCTWRHDATRLRQVLRHLVTNAVKFTEDGGVTVRAIGRPEPDGTTRLVFEVADTGPGVPDIERERIFERFHQLDGSQTRRHGGTGLGLAICRELVQLWGGQIGVRSAEDGGSVFWFDAPGAGRSEG